MRHLILWLYIMCFMVGVAAITLGSLFYIKNRNQVVKYIIFIDLLLAAYLFLDTLNFYMQLFKFAFLDFIQITAIYVLILVSIGLIGYLLKAVYHVIHREVKKSEKILFMSLSSFFLVFILVVRWFTYQEVIEGRLGMYIGFLMPNLFSVIGAFYAIYLILINYKTIDKIIKPFVRACLIIISITGPISIIANVMDYRYVFNYPVAFSPLVFLLINGAGILTLRKNVFYEGDACKDEKDLAKEVPKTDYKSLLKDYNITEREYEIIVLILEGSSNQVIGESLYISPNTVRNHVSNIYKKTSFKNRYELMNFLMQGGGIKKPPQETEV